MIAILHVLLFSIFPILYLYGNNLGEIPFTEVPRALLLSVALAILMLAALRMVTGDWNKASLICTGVFILVFSYGHLYTELKEFKVGSVILARHRLMLVMWGAFLLAWIWFVVRKIKYSREITGFLNIVGLLLVAFQIYSIGSRTINLDRLLNSDSIATGEESTHVGASLPDIYYIILDGYARSDVLKELYGYDNADFLEFLKSRGFYVAESSRANYDQTVLSLASSLNMEYINYFAEIYGVNSKERFRVAQLIKNSAVRKLLSQFGYKFVAFESGYERTELRSADLYWSAETDVVPQITSFWQFNAFESLLLESTLFRAVFDLPWLSAESLSSVVIGPEYQAHRERIKYIFERLDDATTLEGNYFVFAHIVAPHPPFVFDSEGEALTPNSAYRLADGDYYPGSREEYIERYRDQLIFVNRNIMNVIERILEQSDQAPIIILQSDHGPGAYLVWDSPERTNLRERFGILNAYYFPGGDEGWLYPSITPVNTYRILLNRYFDGENELLDDENYFSPWMRPYDFTRVTEMFDEK